MYILWNRCCPGVNKASLVDACKVPILLVTNAAVNCRLWSTGTDNWQQWQNTLHFGTIGVSKIETSTGSQKSSILNGIQKGKQAFEPFANFQKASTGKSWWFSSRPQLNTFEYGLQERRTYNLSTRHWYGNTNEAAKNCIKDHAWLPRNALASSPAFAIENSWLTKDNGLPVQSW